MRSSPGPEDVATFTVVPSGTEFRIGVDRDGDGAYDQDEIDACSDPADASVVPSPQLSCVLFADGFECGDTSAWLSEYVSGRHPGLRTKGE